MKIGKADRRIELQEVAYTRNDFGEAVKGYTSLGSVWAELLKTGSIGETIQRGQDIAVKRLTFKVRSFGITQALKADDRVVYKSEPYDILGIEESGRDQLAIVVQTTTTI